VKWCPTCDENYVARLPENGIRVNYNKLTVSRHCPLARGEWRCIECEEKDEDEEAGEE